MDRKLIDTYVNTATGGILDHLDKVTIEQDDEGRYVVVAHAKGVDRSDLHAISTGKSRVLADRTRRCMMSGKFWSGFNLSRDVNGKSYVSGNFMVMGRYLNSDLKKLGF